MEGYINTKIWTAASGTTLEEEIRGMRHSGHQVKSVLPAAEGNSAVIVYESCLPERISMVQRIYYYRKTGIVL